MVQRMNGEFRKYEKWLSFKSAEFARLGYTTITPEDLWEYFTDFKWKRERPVRYYLEIRDIMEVRPNDYFTYASLNAQVYSATSLDEMNLEDLLH